MKNSLFSDSVKILRAIMPLMIILIHVPFLNPDVICWQGGIECTIWIFISAVLSQLAVPTFFFISGYYFFSHFDTNKWDWQLYFTKIKKRCKTLLFPYLLWNLLYLLPSFLLFLIGRISWDTFNTNLANLGYWHIFWDCNSSPVTNILGVTRPGAVPLDGPLWFVRDLMVVCLLTPIIFFLLRRFNLAVVILGGGTLRVRYIYSYNRFF